MHQIKRYSEEQCTHWSELDRDFLEQSITVEKSILQGLSRTIRYDSQLDRDFLEHFSFKGQLLGLFYKHLWFTCSSQPSMTS